MRKDHLRQVTWLWLKENFFFSLKLIFFQRLDSFVLPWKRRRDAVVVTIYDNFVVGWQSGFCGGGCLGSHGRGAGHPLARVPQFERLVSATGRDQWRRSRGARRYFHCYVSRSLPETSRYHHPRKLPRGLLFNSRCGCQDVIWNNLIGRYKHSSCITGKACRHTWLAYWEVTWLSTLSVFATRSSTDPFAASSCLLSFE